MLCAKSGTWWVEVARRLPGRPENAVKNRWYSMSRSAGSWEARHQARRRLRQGRAERRKEKRRVARKPHREAVAGGVSAPSVVAEPAGTATGADGPREAADVADAGAPSGAAMPGGVPAQGHNADAAHAGAAASALPGASQSSSGDVAEGGPVAAGDDAHGGGAGAAAARGPAAVEAGVPPAPAPQPLHVIKEEHAPVAMVSSKRRRPSLDMDAAVLAAARAMKQQRVERDA